jgi:hypothetical protein
MLVVDGLMGERAMFCRRGWELWGSIGGTNSSAVLGIWWSGDMHALSAVAV